MRIEHIDEVLPHVTGRNDFVVARKDGYVAVDYLFQAPDTFAVPIRRECRGIKFCSATGRVLARPFSKFFNIGEREETQPHLIDFAKPHWVLSKLDGSMIHPMLIDGQLVFATRMGRTQHAVMAERHLTPELTAWFQATLEEGWTPICEWVAPDNRIIIKYPASKLVLLAIRNTITGEYMEPAVVRVNGLRAGLDVVDTHPAWGGSAVDFLAMVRVLQGAEGFVIRFADGLWLKCKAEDYLQKTRAKGAIELEKNAVLWRKRHRWIPRCVGSSGGVCAIIPESRYITRGAKEEHRPHQGRPPQIIFPPRACMLRGRGNLVNG